MDPAAMGAPPMGAPPMGGPMDPNMAAGGQPGQKIKPEQWMQQLDYRLYNLQQQLTALLNQMGVEVPAAALIMPPGVPMAPQPEQAMPGGPMDPSQQAGPAEAGGGGNSAIGGIDPIQGASPELAQGKVAAALPPEVEEFHKEATANAPQGWHVVMVKSGTTGEGYPGSVDEEKPPTTSSPPKPLRGAHPGKTPSLTGPPTAGGSKDPKSRTEAGDSMGPANEEKTSAELFAAGLAEDPKRAVSFIGDPVDSAAGNLADNVAATAALYRSRTQAG
jgi:hypothetical protein